MTPAIAHIALEAPTDVPGSLERFRRFGDDGVDRFDGRTLRRSFVSAGRPVAFAVTSTGTTARPTARIAVCDRRDLAAAVATTERMLAGAPTALAGLAAADAAVARLVAAHPGIVPVFEVDPFAALLRAITAQQVHLRFATTIRGRLAAAFGVPLAIAGEQVRHLDPARVAAAGDDALRALPLTRAKARAVLELAAAVADGELDLAALASRGDHDVMAALTARRGLGRWTAEWFLARVLGRPQVVAGDLAVRDAVGLLYGTPARPGEGETRALTAHWGDAATAAQQVLLHARAAGTLRPSSV